MFVIFVVIGVMFGFLLVCVFVVFVLIIGVVIGGLLVGLGLYGIFEVFNNGFGGGVKIVLVYGVLGVFVLVLVCLGLFDLLVYKFIKILKGLSNEKV